MALLDYVTGAPCGTQTRGDDDDHDVMECAIAIMWWCGVYVGV